MIDRDGAIRLIEPLLRAEERERASQGRPVALGIAQVIEHRFGWIITTQSQDYIRSSDTRDALIGGGPHLVNRHDGSIHLIPGVDYMRDLWEEDYEQRLKGNTGQEPRPAEIPFTAEIRGELERGGRVAALRQLRRNAPQMSIPQADDYITAITAGERPPSAGSAGGPH